MGKNRIETKQADEALLASLGYKQELRRAFTPFEVFGVAFSVIGLVPAMTSVLFNAVPNGGAVSIVWGWALACLPILCIGMAMAELASAAPTSGGLYYWTYTFSSPRCRNLLSWIVGYINTIGSITAVASVDWACAVQIAAGATIGSNQAYVTTNAQLYGIYLAIVLSHGVLVSLGTTILARLQTVYIILNICLCLAIIVALPVATPPEFKNSASYALGNFTNTSGWPSGFAFIVGLLYPLWAIGGYDASIHMSEEASNAAVAIPWAIVGSIAVTGVLGWVMNISLVFCMGTDLANLTGSPVGQPMAQILYNSLGKQGALVLWAMIVLVQYMMGSSALLAASRQTFAFARDGALPFSRLFHRINSYTKTPVNTVWFVVVMSVLLGLLAFAGTQAINAVFTIVVTSQYISYMLPIFARFAFKNNFEPGPFNLGCLGFPVAAIAVSFMFFMVIVFLFPATPQTSVAEMNYTIVVLGGVMFFALVWYYFPVYGGVHWFKGPVENIGSQGRKDSMSQNWDQESVPRVEKGSAVEEVVIIVKDQ
ncbi:amino acid transporter [Leucogyrophana mollusca]|uniref:Amino acid transporter n=1 Tax=Leucogyrophana mollusca TaxID=85980 RepID=A0ACB8BKZ3_9AGAM|nr:amino acid transporter [Leucogyrophana mollusca]